MSETTRKVCGESLSRSLQDRDARVVGKSVSRSAYGSISIGSVGSRMEQRLARAEERYQHTLPRFVSRFFGAPKRSLWSSSYPSVDLNYLLWNPYAEEEVEEVPQAPDVWMKSKKPWVGARVFRMPKSRPFTPMQASRTPKSVYRRPSRRPSTLERLRHKNADMAQQQSVENQALEGLPPFLSSSKTIQKVVRQSQRAHTNRFRPSGVGAQLLPPKIQNQMGVQKQGFQQAKGRFRKDRPTGLRSLQLSSPMMQELMPLQAPVQEEQEVQETVSPWFTREPSTSSVSSKASRQRLNKEGSRISQVGSSRQNVAHHSENNSNPRSAVSSLSRSLRRDVQRKALPSQRAAQNINLGTKQTVAETPASVHALQRSAMQGEQSARSVLPIASIFSEQSRIGQSIARHQASLIRQKESSIGAQTAAKAQRSTPSAQKRQNVRRAQLFSTPDLLDLQSSSSIAAVESVQEKAESPWFTREPQHQAGQKNPKASLKSRTSAAPTREARSRTNISRQDQTEATSGTVQREQRKEASFARREPRVQDVDIFGFGAEPESSSQRVSASTYAMDRMENREDSSYQPIDQRVQERLDRREAVNEDRVARMDAPVSHQVRERRFVPTPDFVDIQEAPLSDDVVLEEQAKESPWFTRSPVVHAAQRKESPASTSRSIVPKAIANTRTEALLKKLEERQLETKSEARGKEKTQRRASTPVESALQRTPTPSAHNPSRPQIVRNTDDKVSLLRSAGLDKQGVALALAYAQGTKTNQSAFAEQIVGKQGWADVRFRRQSPVSYARSARPEAVVIQTGDEAQEATEMVQESVSPWFTREPATSTKSSGSSSSQKSSRVASEKQVLGQQASEKSGALSHMLARSTVSPSLPQEIAVGTKSRSVFSGQPTVRLSTMPSYGLEQTVLSQPQQVAQEQEVAQDSSRSNATWLSPQEKSQEQRAANALIKRVAKLGVKAKVYKSPKGTMMDAKAAKALGFEPPKGKSRIPLTWVLEAVENKSNSGILPNWAQRSSEMPLHKGTADMVNSLNKASSMDEVLRVIFERTSSRQVAPSFQSVPVHATQVLQHIRQEAHQIAQESELQAAQMDAISSAVADNKSIQRQTQKVLSSFTGLKPMATAKVEAVGPSDDKLSKLTRKLQDLILVAEQQGQREAQGGARLAEDSAQAIEEGRGEPKGLDESVSEELNLDQLYRDVLRSVEDAINLKRVLRFDNDDQFDGGW